MSAEEAESKVEETTEEAAEEAAEGAGEEPTQLDAPHPQAAPHLDPAAFFSMLNANTEAEAEAKAAAAAQAKRRVLRLVLRYGLVLATVGAIGAATAYAVTIPRRTDVPTLKTKDDGRYDFGSLAKPALPPGALAPGAPGDKTHLHGAELRRYLLPAPKGATLDPAYPADGGWVEPEVFGNGYVLPGPVGIQLSGDGVRRIAARAWTTPDGQRTTVMLLQFPDEDAAADYVTEAPGGTPLGFGGDGNASVPVTVRDVADGTRRLDLVKYDTVTPPAIPANVSGAGLVGRRAMWEVGDTVAVVITTAPKKITDVPTIQVIQLESEMLT